jgi:hypothetical protein
VVKPVESEADLSREVLRLAHVSRWLAHQMRWSYRSRTVAKGDTGFPDWIFVRPPRLIAVELKDATAQPYPNQERWLQAMRECDGIEVYLWRPADLLEGRITEVLA